jgi:hypothetical protein
MALKVDDMTGVERPRRRRAVAVLAVIVPIVVLAGAAAWFVRAYIMPPMVAISEPLAVSSVESALARTEPQPRPAPANETTGASFSPTAANSPLPAVRYSTNSAEVWASVPLPGPPRQIQSFAAAPASAVAPSDPVTAAVPLPPRKPRISTAEFDLPAVPLPRPRPLSSN